MTAKENASKNKIQNQNNHVISHHTVDKFGKWKINGAEPQPEVTVQVSVCQDGCNKVKVVPPRMLRLNKVTLRAMFSLFH